MTKIEHIEVESVTSNRYRKDQHICPGVYSTKN